MSKLVEYTLEIYKADRRNKNGKRFVAKEDYAASPRTYINIIAEKKRELGFIVYIFETYVLRENVMTGKEFQERYDTPWSCSPSTETYWSS
jgi:hypothetical protein